MWWLLLLAWLVWAGGIGCYAARSKGRLLVEGVTLGILAGPFGWLLVATLPAGPSRRPAAHDASEPDEVDVDLWDTHEIMGMPKVQP